MQLRKIALCVEAWWSEENLFAWNFTRKRLLQEGQATCFNDRIYVVHVITKGKEVENWDKGTPVLGDVQTELAAYDHAIVELHGDVVPCITQFLHEEGIHLGILSLKDHNRVKKTLSMGASTQLLSKAPCACAIVSPRFSAGDHFRIQAKLQPDALVANSAAQFRRRLAVVLNSCLWDSALTEYVAKTVILPGDRVILVRCLNENVQKKSTEELQVERDYLRELGWHKFKGRNVSLAVEVIKTQTRVLSDFIEEKGVDLLIMARSDSNKLKRSIKKENVSFQAFPHKCPCPFMIVPTEALRGCNRFVTPSRSSGFEDQPSAVFWSTSGTSQNHFSRKAWPFGSQRQPFGIFGLAARRCQSLDNTDQNQGLKPAESLQHDDSIELSSTALVDVDRSDTRTSCRSTERLIAGSTSETQELQTSAPSVAVGDGDSRKEAVVRRLQKQLMEKEREVRCLKQQIRHLKSI